MKELSKFERIQKTLENYALEHTWFLWMSNVGLPLISLITLLLLAYHPWVISGIIAVLFSGYVFIGFCNILVLLKRRKEKKCGLCGNTATVGPMGGGPIAWYCEDCHVTVRKFLDLQKEHEDMLETMRNH
jgi:hypothetical protein